MFKINKDGHVSDETLKGQIADIFRANGINMSKELLEFANKFTTVFFRFMREGLFCDECKRKLYEAVEKE